MSNRFECVYQHDSMQCGIACLAMICRHYGYHCSIDNLSNLCHAYAEGLSMLAISQASQTLGMRATGVKLSLDRLIQSPLPCILHWRQNHFVVLYRIKGNKFYIADPAKGIIKFSKEEFANSWLSAHSDGESTGVALMLEPTPQFYTCNNIKQQSKDGDSRSLKFFLGYISNYRRQFAVIALAMIIGSVIQLALPFLTQSIVDVGINNHNIRFIWLVLIAQMVLTFSRTSLDFIRRWILLKIGISINVSLLSDFFTKLLRLPMPIFDTKATGDLMQRMNDHSRVNNFVTQDTLNITFATFTFLAFSVVLASYSVRVFIIFITGSIIYALWISRFLRRRKVLDYELFEQRALDNNKTLEFFTSMQEIKLQNCEQRRLNEWKSIQSNLLDVQSKTLRLKQTQEAGCTLINEIKNIIITATAANAVITGDMTLGMMLAVQYIIGQLSVPVEQLMTFIYSLQDVNISLERINEIRRQNDEDLDADVTIPDLQNNHSGITFNDVNFRYDPHALTTTVQHINISIPQGKITAIVGASGSGKTTLLKLLLGYYPIEQGKILVGGTDIATINKKWWRKQCGVVMQDGIIFSESIARNIAVDDTDIDTSRMISAAKIACIHDYITSLPLKYDTRIGRDGTGLSIGQKQRILIARAVYRNPKYIFLDEATNSLDANSERAIVHNLNKFYAGKTVIIIAHRLSTVRNAHQIVVLDKGSVVECGNHDTLTATRGAYYRLVKNQLELGN